MDTESIVAELMKAERLKSTKTENKLTRLEWKQEKWKDLNKKIYSFYTDNLSKLRYQGSFNTRAASSTHSDLVSISANSTAPMGNHTLKIHQLASAQFETGDKLNSTVTGKTKLVDLGMTADENNKIVIEGASGTKSITISDTTTINDVVQKFKDAGLNASFDATQKRFFISSKESGYKNAFGLSTSGTVDLSKLGLSEITKTKNGDGTVTVTGGKNVVAPKDAVITYNGVKMSSSSNTITANGLTMTLKGITPGGNTADTLDDETINVNVENNKQAVFDMVKSFVKSYNELITGMNESYYATSAKGFEPLTDEQKEAMTEDQITKWEDKIKDSLLRRDGTLSSLVSSMRSTFSESVEFNGKKYSLSSLGIVTGNYQEKGLLHIKGDSEDTTFAGLENELMNLLTESPDVVAGVLNKLSDKLYSSMTESMKSTSLRSAMTFYNDKEMTKSISKYKTDIKTMETKLANLENRYFKQFSAMESAMSKMNSQSSQLSSLLGMNSN
jgi:flagellar hook-associated protein 2